MYFNPFIKSLFDRIQVHLSVDDCGVVAVQEATKPEETVELSEVNTTCMYPVLDV